MVHALEEIRRLLRPGGILLDLHPVAGSWMVEVHQAGRLLHAEPFPGHEVSDQDIRIAEGALAAAVQGGLYVVESSREFEFLTYGPSVAELREFLVQENAYDNAPMDADMAAREAEVAARIEAIMQAAGRGAEVASHEQGRITRLRPAALLKETVDD
jgi:SAM-dependent methyltransferase